MTFENTTSYEVGDLVTIKHRDNYETGTITHTFKFEGSLYDSYARIYPDLKSGETGYAMKIDDLMQAFTRFDVVEKFEPNQVNNAGYTAQTLQRHLTLN